jgi:hypothetical protein
MQLEREGVELSAAVRDAHPRHDGAMQSQAQRDKKTLDIATALLVFVGVVCSCPGQSRAQKGDHRVGP